ncbi:MAG: hypothetical protein KAS39_04560, partial [Actinomycetia bacterium]|nr:hypothetical protein [Actinomycetes bacterium]
ATGNGSILNKDNKTTAGGGYEKGCLIAEAAAGGKNRAGAEYESANNINTKKGTVSVWVKANDDVAASKRYIFSLGDHQTGEKTASIVGIDNNSIVLKFYQPGNNTPVSLLCPDTGIFSGMLSEKWNNISFTFDSTIGNASLYINGKPAGKYNDSPWLKNDTHNIMWSGNSIETSGDSPEPLKGKLDNFMIFDRVLTIYEINQVIKSNYTPALTAEALDIPILEIDNTPPPAVNGLKASVVSIDSVLLEWTPLSGIDDFYSYELIYTPSFLRDSEQNGENNNIIFTNRTEPGVITINSLIINELETDILYDFRILATDKKRNAGLISDPVSLRINRDDFFENEPVIIPNPLKGDNRITINRLKENSIIIVIDQKGKIIIEKGNKHGKSIT